MYENARKPYSLFNVFFYIYNEPLKLQLEVPDELLSSYQLLFVARASLE